MCSPVARERLGARQAELLRALAFAVPPPRGFDAAAVVEEAHALARKRTRTAARGQAALARALGKRFPLHFDDYARAHAFSGHAGADGAAFARWFLARAGGDGVAETIEWHPGLRAVLAARARRPGDPELAPELRADLELFRKLIGAVVARRGPEALEELGLKAALV